MLFDCIEAAGYDLCELMDNPEIPLDIEEDIEKKCYKSLDVISAELLGGVTTLPLHQSTLRDREKRGWSEEDSHSHSDSSSSRSSSTRGRPGTRDRPGKRGRPGTRSTTGARSSSSSHSSSSHSHHNSK